MKLFATLACLALALAGCSKGDATGNVAAAAPVAAAPAPAGQNWTETVSKTPEGGYRMGNPDAPIKLVEYGSRLCPTCGAFAREGYEPLTKTYVASGKVSFEYREFLVHGAPDLPPALLGLCGGAQPFFPILEQMYQNQQGFDEKLQAMSPAIQAQLQKSTPVDAIRIMAEQMGLIDFIKQRGIPEAKARQCLADKPMIDFLTKVTQDKTADGTVTGTPTFLINGKTATGVITWPQMVQALKAAGA